MSEILFFEDSHTYLVDGEEVPSVTTILHPITSASYGKINESVLKYAAQRGTAVHEATQIIDFGGEPDIYPEISGYVKAYAEFLNVYRPEWEMIEQIVYNPKGYIGTLDRMGVIGGHKAVLDIKTNGSPTKENLISVCGQTAAYVFALTGMEDRDFRRYALYLKSDGNFRLVDCAEYEAKYGFDSFGLWDLCFRFYTQIERIKTNGK